MIEILGYILAVLAVLAGLSLGLTGSGGAILSVPILVYLLKVDPVSATGYSLFIVGTTSLFGSVQNAIKKTVDFKTALIFGIPSILAVYLTRGFLLPIIPNDLLTIGSFHLNKSIALMILFSAVMILASFSMIKGKKKILDEVETTQGPRFIALIFQGAMIGLIAGLVGAGGGFLIVPALVLLAQTPMKRAIGTSLFIITLQSLFGFVGELQTDKIIDWKLLLIFTGLSIVGIIIGVISAQKIDGKKLKKGFGWFVLVMGIFILLKETLF